MILGIVAHDGASALLRHLGSATDNESVEMEIGPGLVAAKAADAMAELRRMAAGCRTRRPFIHVHASPSLRYTEQQWTDFWEIFEQEFDLELQPWFEYRHAKLGKGGRKAPHRHRLYLRVRPDRTAIPLSHSHRRGEKAARLAEIMAGERMTPGAHDIAVIRALRHDGRTEAAGLIEARRRQESSPHLTAPTAKERKTSERLGDLSGDEIARRCHVAYLQTLGGADLGEELKAQGLRVAAGEKAVLVVGPGGSATPLLRAINNGAGEKIPVGQRLRRTDLNALLARYDIPPLEAVRASLGSEPTRTSTYLTRPGLERAAPIPALSSPTLGRMPVSAGDPMTARAVAAPSPAAANTSASEFLMMAPRVARLANGGRSGVDSENVRMQNAVGQPRQKVPRQLRLIFASHGFVHSGGHSVLEKLNTRSDPKAAHPAVPSAFAMPLGLAKVTEGSRNVEVGVTTAFRSTEKAPLQEQTESDAAAPATEPIHPRSVADRVPTPNQSPRRFPLRQSPGLAVETPLTNSKESVVREPGRATTGREPDKTAGWTKRVAISRNVGHGHKPKTGSITESRLPAVLTHEQRAKAAAFLTAIVGGASKEAEEAIANAITESRNSRTEGLRRERQQSYTGLADPTGSKEADRQRNQGGQAGALSAKKRGPAAIEEGGFRRSSRWSLPYELMGIEAEATLPTISALGWKARFKAKVAGLPAEVGAQLAFVEAVDAQTNCIRLQNGALLVARPERITLVHEGGDPNSRSTIAVMLEHAKARGWPSIDVTGGTPRWRRRVVRMALAQGLVISTRELDVVVVEERNLLDLISLIRDWNERRGSESDEKVHILLCAIADHESLPRIWRRLDVDLQDKIVEYGEQSFPLSPSGP